MARYRRNNFKKIGTTLLIVALAVITLALSIYLFNDKREANPDNLLSVDDYTIADTNTAVGLKFDVRDNGIINVSGKATADYSIDVETITLPAGTYTLGGMKTNVGKYGLKATYGDNVHYAGVDGATGATFTLSESTAVTVSIFVKEDARIFETVKPTLAEGNSEIGFFK